jgi:hypothetical protein
MVQNLIKMAKAAKIAKAASIGEAIANIWSAAFKSLGGLPGIGLTLAVAGAAAGVAALLTSTSAKRETGDDVVSAGYGKRMLFDKGSITALNDNDKLYATTNTLKPSRNNEGGGGRNDDRLIAAMEKIASRPAAAYFAQTTSQVASILGKESNMGTSQKMSTGYNLA